MSETLDLANLGLVVDQGEGEYEAPSEFFRPPEPTPNGQWETLIAVETPTDNKLYPIKDFDTGNVIPGFAANIQFQIQGGSQDEKTFYAMIDTRKAYQRNSSMVKDYLFGMGYTGRLVTMQDFKDAIQATIAPVGARLTWSSDKCDCGAKRLKLKDFPLKADGVTRNHVAKCPDCNENVGARVKIAMFRVTRAND